MTADKATAVAKIADDIEVAMDRSGLAIREVKFTAAIHKVVAGLVNGKFTVEEMHRAFAEEGQP